ncbi:pentatricopeptide repeat-containing protein At1g25360 [Abrus precatorius]|uniref:Pentatricopeptide repeat-containing protein At1g25360 n=1 Tax=Abrus precatorius TaxID=3816 RepID=A0A8B8MA85_ABRPR|nr:pentatricopeptide repeat-containing protein At1g25360 [Abrus precatorius]XP_027365454.1 pentatricopeptide repeat-containing protein At1g25360 [Abrus precatorius]XP_027365455.1 pentatricopeptide repeat-containing protein At1g25360 [Abrus precatorius]XP_027365456.1 pentatricopeptide repeat-containing protein At1g25360 [Abrus precatorius]
MSMVMDVRALGNRYLVQLTHTSLTRAVHAHILTSGFSPSPLILNRLIDRYCKSSNIPYARHLFDRIPKPDIVATTSLLSAYSSTGNIKLAHQLFHATPFSIRDTVSYNAMITAFSHCHDGHAALQLFIQMKRHGFAPDPYTFSSVLGALSLIADVERHCQQLHCEIIKWGSLYAPSVLNALMSCYVCCASSPLVDSCLLMAAARKLFDEAPPGLRDEPSWTTIISGYVRNGDLVAARELLDGMTDQITVAWNAMISGYVHRGLYEAAFDLFRRMHNLGIEQDEYAYTSVLSACSNVGLFNIGRQVHAYVLRTVVQPSQHFILSVNNALITLYTKCGKLVEARQVFNKMPVKDLISWNAILSGYVNAQCIEEANSIFREMPERNLLTWTVMISGLAQNGFGEEALKLFNQMKLEGLEPCDYAYAGAITSCAVLGSLDNGQQLHSQIVRLGHDSSLSAGNALITMYARCGLVEAADTMFVTMPYVDSVSWNAMIAALAQHGHGIQAVQLYEQMLKEGILPDRITFLTILSACSHAGLVKEGRHYFDTMCTRYGITPGEDHYARLIDLLCRAGMFSEAKNVTETMPFEPGPPIWDALLAGCRIHGNIELGIQAAERLFELMPQQDGTYIILSNMYATLGKWDEVARVRKLMRERGVKKEPGCSWIEVENMVHVFLVDDALHPEVHAVYRYLEQLVHEIRKLGYVPNTKFVLHDMESEHKENALSTHSERLAVVYGIMKLPSGAPIRVFKNLRICGDCHNAFKFISKVVEREIIVRDRKRFHHFRNGECSCGNYW